MNTRIKLSLVIIVLSLSALACVNPTGGRCDSKCQQDMQTAIEDAGQAVVDYTVDAGEALGEVGCDLAADVNEATGLGGPCNNGYQSVSDALDAIGK